MAATVPGTLELLLLVSGSVRKRKRATNARPAELRLAVVIPAHNEALLIARCVESVASSAREAGGCEVVVVADNCTDETALVAEVAGARVLVRRNALLRGKGYALRTAFDQLQSEGFNGFLVIDADSIVTSNLVSGVAWYLANGSAAVQCRYRVANNGQSLRTRLMDAALLAFNVARPRGRAGWGLSAGILGNGFALRAETLQQVPWDATSIVEDLEYHIRLVAAGDCVDFVDAATVYGEIPARADAAKGQRSRWEGGRLRMAREWVPGLARQVARGKLRLAEPLLELLTLPLAYHVMLLAVALTPLPWPWRIYTETALALVALHVLGACSMGGHPLKTASALAAAPFYMIWKIGTICGVLAASRRSASWVRSGRDSEITVEPVD